MKRSLRGKAFMLFLAAAAVFATVSCGAPESTGNESSSPESVSEQPSGEQSSESEEESTEEQSSSSRKNPLADNASAQALVESYGSFAEAHDAFTTTLAREENDDYSIPEPPEGLFDLVSYPSKVGDLAAYVSSDPGDGQKHPIIIWVVGGWGNGIDDFPWCYPAWDNDQTGSAFWQAGLLTMYPSFRGGNGNPGHYEALFGEVDDIISAYEYAASLPYVDPDRIYLGGHSTGGTRALLASEYTDKFRAVFCFGAVDEVKYHNNSQFTFDTDNEDEFTMRSPIHWLDNVKSPTFLIEGRDGNSANLERMEAATDNENIHCYVIEGADHFSTLAPLTRLAAQKILADTGAEVSISITQEELDAAFAQTPETPVPVMTQRTVDWLGLTFSCPHPWLFQHSSEEDDLIVCSRYEEDNAWDMSVLYLSGLTLQDGSSLTDLADSLRENGYEAIETTIGGAPAVDCTGIVQDDEGYSYYERYVIIQNGDFYVTLDYMIPESYLGEAQPLFQSVLDSVSVEPVE
nr:prolyl oligopeptidase family serine peptidase [uncultured Acetatifactor sp.]